MAFTALLSIRGINNPLDELLISSCADAFGELVPMPTPCAAHAAAASRPDTKRMAIFLILLLFFY